MDSMNIVKRLAATGTTKKDIQNALARKLNEGESAMFNRYKKEPVSGKDRVKKHRESNRIIELPPVEDMARRLEMEADPQKWLMHYMAAAYPAPFSNGHIDLIKNTIHAAETGEGTAVAQPRGEGKTTVLRGVNVYIVVKKLVKFPVLVGWKLGDASNAIKRWLHMLTNSPEFAADYPDYCAPFLHSTHKTALGNFTWDESVPEFGGLPCGALVETIDKVITLPNSMGAVAARSVQGDAKGLQAQMVDGSIIRPDFLLFDDAQNPRHADKPNFVDQTVDIIENIFMGMAGPQKRIVSAFAFTIEAENDVGCHFYNRRDFTGSKVSRIQIWPDGSTGGTWESKKACKIRPLWEEWRNIYLDDGQEAANKFFKSRQKKMTGKMETSWIHRFDKNRDVCDIDAAMHDWYKLGEDIFSRAQQNNPITRGVDLYTLTPAIVRTRVMDRLQNTLPDSTEIVVAATDLNPSYGFTSVIAGFNKSQSCAIGYYGIFDEKPIPISNNASDRQKHQAIYNALTILGKRIASHQCKPTCWIIDGGGAQSKPVRQFARNAQELIGIRVIVAYGRAGKAARMTSQHKRRIGEEWMECRNGLDAWLIWNADYWREVMQKSFTCETGAPGGTTLPESGDHRDFSEQICREKLKSKGLVGDRMIWIWDKQPGKNDYADSLNMAFVAASVVANIGTGGFIDDRPKRKTYTREQLRRR